MKIHEFQAKALLREFEVPVPIGEIARTPAEVRRVAERLGLTRAVVKAQIHAGGRGKGGGIKLGTSPSELEKLSESILGMSLVTPQTGREGRLVRSVLVEAATEIARELYLSVLVDRETCRLVVIASTEGGMDIEEVARTRPDAILKLTIDPLLGLRPYQAQSLARKLGFGDATIPAAVRLITNVVRLFRESDASLVEINPLVETKAGEVLALDAKINLDDNALYRHPALQGLRDLDEEDPLEVEASKFDLNYIKLDGDIGCMVNGAGLAMATMDIIQLSGRSPANFLDVGGGANVTRIANAFRILTSDPDVRAVLVNIFGGIVRCDRVAEGIIEAYKTVDIKIPLVVRLAGTNAKEGRDLLAQSGLDFHVADSLADAAAKIIAALRGGK